MSAFNAQFYITYIVIGISAIINSFLIYFATKIRPRSIDIILMIVIASIELIVPFYKTSVAIYSGITGYNLIFKDVGCQVLGFLVNTIYFTEISLSFLLANIRLARVSNRPLSKYFWYIFFSFSIPYPIFLIAMSSTNRMTPYPSNATCFVNPNNSFLDAFVFFYFIVYAYTSTFGIVYTYIQLSRKVNKTLEFIDLELNPIHNKKTNTMRHSNYRSAKIKTYIIVVFYATFMLISFSALILCVYIDDSTLLLKSVKNWSMFICIIFFLVGITANSGLLMVLHTGIGNEMTTFFDRFKKK